LADGMDISSFIGTGGYRSMDSSFLEQRST
jgi:hypothetical protein